MSELRATPGDAPLSIVAAGMRLVGDLSGPGIVKIDGRVEGSVSGARQIIIGRDGSVRGNLQGGEIVLAGNLDGSVLEARRFEAQASAVVTGDVETKTIVLHEGARLNGSVRMDSAETNESERPVVQVMR